MFLIRFLDRYVHKLFSIDLRSLALSRIILGHIFLYDILQRFEDVDDFYSDLGILTRGEFLQSFAVNPKFSLLLLNGTTLYVEIIFFLSLILGLFFILGLKTRLVSFLIFIVYLSLHHRLPLIINGGDILIRLCFFYFSFLPINAKFSMDAALAKARGKYNIGTSNTHFSIWSAIIFIQIILIYLFTFLLKWHPDWHTHFTAVHYALHLEAYARPWAQFLINYPAITKSFTFYTILAEALVVLFLIIPFKHLFFRYSIIIMLIGLHFGIFTTFKLPIFSWACIALWLSILPGSFWQTIQEKYNVAGRLKEKNLIIYYDDECTFCYKMVFIVLEFLLIDKSFIKVKKASTNQKVHELLQEKCSWIVQENGVNFIRYEAFIILLQNSPFKFLKLILNNHFFKFCGDNAYLIISHNRKIFNLPLRNLHHGTINLKTNKLSTCFGFLVMGIIIAWNIKGIGYYKDFRIGKPFREIGLTLQIFQKWDMFAPTPWKDNGYFIFEGIKKDGSTWDVFYDEPVDFKWLPKDIPGRFKNTQWRKFLVNLWSRKNRRYRPYFAQWLCRRWNNNHKGYSRIEKINGYYMLNRTAEFGKKKNKIYKKSRIIEQKCR